MALDIPMPESFADSLMKGLTTGSNLYSAAMQPVLERQRMAMEQQRIRQAAAQFQQEQALREKEFAHSTMNDALNKQILMQQLLAAQHANDPMYAIKEYQQKMDYINKLKAQQANQGGIGAPQFSIPSIPNISPLSMTSGFQSGSQSVPISAPDLPPISIPNMPEQSSYQRNPISTGPNWDQIQRAMTNELFGIKNTELHGPARDAMDLEELKNQVGEKSEVYQRALASYNAGIDAKKDLRDLRARTMAGLKPGEKEFFDPQSGKPLGKEVPFTNKERESEEGNILFNELYPYVYKGASPFSGQGSITRLQQAAANYNTDPMARKLFDDYLLADKMLSATTVNEASTLKARGTNATYNMLKESLETQDIPKIVKNLIKQYQIPASAQLQAAMRYQKILSDARNKARSTVPATQKLFYDPKQQQAYEATQLGNVPNNVATSVNKNVIVINPSGKRFRTTEENAANLPAGWKRG